MRRMCKEITGVDLDKRSPSFTLQNDVTSMDGKLGSKAEPFAMGTACVHTPTLILQRDVSCIVLDERQTPSKRGF